MSEISSSMEDILRQYHPFVAGVDGMVIGEGKEHLEISS